MLLFHEFLILFCNTNIGKRDNQPLRCDDDWRTRARGRGLLLHARLESFHQQGEILSDFLRIS
jgi:hypothetical protein